MIKRLLFLPIFFLAVSLYGQKNRTIDIDWKQIVLGTGENTEKIPGFKEQFFSFDPAKGIAYNYSWDDYRLVDPSSIQILNVKYSSIQKSDLKSFNLKSVPSSIRIQVVGNRARFKEMAALSFCPIVFQDNQYKKVEQLTFSYNYMSKTGNLSKLAVTNSVLANGDWFKFQIEKSGVYKITPGFLADLGIDLNNVDPSTIKIYGNGGQMLPLLNQDTQYYDLQENPIKLIGGEDGTFSGQDYILFYGEGVYGYSEENETNLNLYEDKAYYYITYGGNSGKRIVGYSEPTGVADIQLTTFNDYQFYEVDNENLVKLGRRWFGDRFDIQRTRDYIFDFPNLVNSTLVNVKVLAASTAESNTSMNVGFNGQSIGTLNFSRITGTTLASARELTQSVSSSTDQITISLNYLNNGNPTAIGYLDFISLEAERGLVGTGKQFIFSNNQVSGQTGIGEYTFTNSSDYNEIWEVTNLNTITSIENQSGTNTISFKSNLGIARKFVALTPTDYYTPTIGEDRRVENQNIKGTIFSDAQDQFQDIDYLIITNSNLLGAANRLAEHHRSLNNFNVKVLTLDKIYNEFSSGHQDIAAIRNVVKYIYDNASEPSRALKYLCLLGDASVDYKDRLKDNNNIVPTFESLSSFSLVSSFATDDFYGCMDPQEGSMAGSDLTDIAIGRILADTPQLANDMVSKIISYNKEQSLGRWRNSVLLIADDVDDDWEETIQRNLDELGQDLEQRKPFFNISKIYADSYQQESSTSGARYPKVNEAIVEAIEAGAVAIDYFGHGGEDGLAKEFIFTKSNAVELNNINKYPFLITVTCEFTKFDNPLRPSAGEFMYWNREGGAVGLISTTRDVIVTFGISVNDRLNEFLFPDGNVYPTVGEAVRQLKNSYTTNSKRVIFFFGDPAMKMAIPNPDIRLTQINDIPITQQVDTLKALSKVKITGEVVDASGNVLNNYNGVVFSSIYDKPIDRTTLANDGVRNSQGELIKLDYTSLGSILFRGKASVTNGVFDYEFVVPRDIGIPVGTGKLSFYASQNGTTEDRTGANQTILVGGLNENAPEDNTGPQIQLFMNDESFISGGVTNSTPVLIAKLQDDNGINTASGIGHDISAILDGDENNPIILNDFYETELDDYTRGTVNYNLKDLDPGLHTITFKGWDVYNNSSTQEIQFTVAEDGGFTLSNVLNYPNPFVSQTEFWFEHSSAPSDILEVQVQVFTVSGKVIWTQNQTLTGRTSYREDIQWNGRDDFGDKIGKGVYVYKISVKSTLTNERVEKFEKLVIL